ncbi:unnamed protein product [Paramecium sonneborni]|uniref:Helicase ATP-binding domain-containing protein n=1 Tax=Paramecium sonneborni TaxID=65129 RepID=A0A8S1QLH6_9CILI|nr:unnamed protein product [Paramecium sonneborni]
MLQQPDIQRHLELIDEESDISSIENTLEEISIDAQACLNQKQICINNTEIYFPHQKPYEEQLNYMQKVISILDNSGNGLLESPTGTGKTLSLLCASLGWLNKNRKTQINSNIPTKIKIIYASRTHSQLKQVAQELQNSVYRPNISILGSRDQYCLREDFQIYSGNDLKQRCCNLIKAKKCEFFDKEILHKVAKSSQKRICNLEESKQFGLDQKFCPYFLEKSKTELADLILLPYNYLLNNNQNKVLDLNNSIIIFDEAHNVPKCAEEGGQFEISEAIIQKAKNELEFEMQDFVINPENLKDLQAIISKQNYQGNLFNNLKSEKIFNNILEALEQFLSDFSKFKNYFNSQNKNDSDNQDQIQVLEESIIDQIFYSTDRQINFQNILDYMQDCFILTKYFRLKNKLTPNFQSWITFIVKIYNIKKFDKQKIFNSYRLVLKKSKNQKLSIEMWCLDPSLIFNIIRKKYKIHSIILTSGTLSPLNSWESELQIKFNEQVAIDHVINVQKNVRVYLHQYYNFSKKYREDKDQIKQIGNQLIKFSNIIPGGILVIFPSYDMMNNFKIIWERNNIIKQLNNQKKCFWEEKGKNELRNFQQSNQAILFAIHRGKVSEGINFSDDLCRALFLIGVPFLYKKELRIEQKMQFLNKQNYKDLNSEQWYNQQAIRATNQALGRVIRHINDFGIIYLCDQRYSCKQIKSGLSKWVCQALEYWNDDVFQKTKDFFQMKRELPVSILIFQIPNQNNSIVQQNTSIDIEESIRQRQNESETKDHEAQASENLILIEYQNQKKIQLIIRKPIKKHDKK